MVQQLWSITRNTFTEAIRQPIFSVLVLIGVLALVINQSLSGFTMEHGRGDNKMLIDLGLSTVFLVGVWLSAFTASGVLSAEIERKTALTVVSKPVPRPVFVLAKYLGVAGAVTVAYLILCAALVLTWRHEVMSTASDKFDMPVIVFGVGGLGLALAGAAAANYWFGRVFTSTLVVLMAAVGGLAVGLILVVGKGWVFQPIGFEFAKYDGELVQLLIALLLVLEGVWAIAAVAIACSTRLGQLPTLLICFGLFVVGVAINGLNAMVNQALNLPPYAALSESVPAIFAAGEAWAAKLVFLIAKLMYVVTPNLQFLWVSDAVTQGNKLTAAYIGTVSGYAVLYAVAALAFAVALFQRREVG